MFNMNLITYSKFILLLFWIQEIWNQIHWLQPRFWRGWFLPKVLRENPFPYFFSLLEATWISWLMMPSWITPTSCFHHHSSFLFWRQIFFCLWLIRHKILINRNLSEKELGDKQELSHPVKVAELKGQTKDSFFLAKTEPVKSPGLPVYCSPPNFPFLPVKTFSFPCGAGTGTWLIMVADWIAILWWSQINSSFLEKYLTVYHLFFVSVILILLYCIPFVFLFQRTHIYVKTHSICLSLTYFSKYNTLQIYPCCPKWQDSFFFSVVDYYSSVVCVHLCVCMCVGR